MFLVANGNGSYCMCNYLFKQRYDAIIEIWYNNDISNILGVICILSEYLKSFNLKGIEGKLNEDFKIKSAL